MQLGEIANAKLISYHIKKCSSNTCTACMLVLDSQLKMPQHPWLLKPCPHYLRKVRLSHKSATVAENGETTAKFGECRTFLRQCGQAISLAQPLKARMDPAASTRPKHCGNAECGIPPLPFLPCSVRVKRGFNGD